ncbi:MAG: alpha-tubulin suppressor-like RCC1 family protein, partial [Polyangiales bacterium]
MVKISGLAVACLTLAGCSIVANSGDFEIPVDGGPGSDAQMDGDVRIDVPSDGGPDTQADVSVGVDVGPAPDCTEDEECNATNANAICGFEDTCVVQDCVEGFADCDMAFNNGCEIHTTESADNCGRCGEVCDFDNAEESCINSVCEFEGCQDSWGDCNGNLPFDGCEVRLTSGGACGTCETVCLIPTSLCDVQEGVALCVPNCEAGEIECEGGCVNIETDPANCGVCGAADCPTPARATAICETSMCGFECEEGRGDCNEMQSDGCEVDTLATVEHCGMCGMACEDMGALWTCNAGTCEIDQCDPVDQFSDCDGIEATGCEVDILNDPMNCGGCGIVCDGLCGSGYCDPIDEVTGQDEHVCIRRRSGTMLCWGTNLSGQLGDGTSTARVLPTIVLDPESMMSASFLVREISVGQSNTCAIDVAGEIWCWGSSAGGATGSPVIPTIRPRRLSGDAAFTARTFTEIAGGERSNCAVDDAQHAWCWGSNSTSQLGIGVAGSTVPLPTRVADTDLTPLDELVVQLAIGNAHGCARLMDGSVRCWGQNDRGQAGTGVLGEVNSAQDVGLSGIVDIAAGDHHTCAADAAGAMWCWGINDNGQFGNGTTVGSLAPLAVTVGVVSNLSAGLEHTCGSVDGLPRCWGRGDDGELGTGALVDSQEPAMPLGVSSSALLIAVHNYSCAFGSDGLSCWGSNARGQLAREATIIRT